LKKKVLRYLPPNLLARNATLENQSKHEMSVKRLGQADFPFDG